MQLIGKFDGRKGEIAMTNASLENTVHWTLSLSHGTLEMRELEPSRRFYADFLGLETVKRGDVAVWVRCGGGWMVACVRTGERAQALPIDIRWCLDMASAEEVDAAHAAAHARKAEFNIRDIRPIEVDEVGRSFCLQDLDGNWWEIGYRPGRLFDDLFAAKKADPVS
jgi:catechol 2,3-dioxygenase-like lactoylglutathione lyase family enzyme